MGRLGHLLILAVLWAGSGLVALAQTGAAVVIATQPLCTTISLPDTARMPAARPVSLTFTGSTDQRFFFFNDTRNESGRRIPVSIYGLRAGFLFPMRHPRQRTSGEMRAAFKAGLGFYFVNQTLNRPGLLPNTSEGLTRRLRIVTAFFEPFLYRKKAIEISLPLELGYGHSRYERTTGQLTDNEVARGVFVPAGVGLSASYQFPALRWFKPLHWFGFNVLTGYRFILKKDVPISQINYTGLYLSIGPSFYLENLTADVGEWRKKRKRK